MNTVTRLLTTLSLAGALGLGLGATAEANPGAPSTSTRAYYPTNICVTPYTKCVMWTYVPAGSPCWCATPWGASNGRAS